MSARFAAVLLAPDVAVVAGVHQFSADLQVVAALHHASFEDGADAQRLPNRVGIGVLALVHEGGVARHHLEVRQRDRLLMRLSVMPSLRYSAFGSPLAFTNGNTASESIVAPPLIRDR